MVLLLSRSLWETLGPSLCLSALLAHQIFRRCEMFSLLLHSSLVFLPPAMATSYTIFAPSDELGVFSTMVFSYVVYLGMLSTSVIFYRFSPFHPLHRYPGPFWCRTSMFWHAVRITAGQQMRYLRVLHERYGDIVRIGPNMISVRDVSLIGPVLGASGIPKSAFYKGTVLSEETVHIAGIQNIEEHSHRRRAWTRGLAPTALRHYENIAATRIRQLVDVLEVQKGVVVLGDWFNYLAFDFMSDMAYVSTSSVILIQLYWHACSFNGGSELMQEGDRDNIWALLEKGIVAGLFIGQVPWLGIYLGYIPGATGPINTLLDYGREQSMKRVAQGSITRDLFYYLNNEDLPQKEPPPFFQLLNDGIVAIIAGADTTSSALTSIFYCLLRDPSTYAALQDEVDQVYPLGENVYDMKRHHDLHYLTAVIHEALRLFPPAPTNSSRQVPHHSKPLVFGSVVLPPGTLIHISPYVLHRDPRNFVFPDTFWPERWLIASGQLTIESARLPQGLAPPPGHHGTPDFQFVHNEAAFIPFSVGPMNCPGKGLAMQQMRTVVCALVQKFWFRLQAGWDPRGYEENFKDYLTANRPGLPVELEPRF
ncbi:high nitrogen upregulated cytochrome P450 monooxygenase 2 [Dichomitus squalens]|uniref:High nitrogen upregulated cytochrome P450 monooxygenase 2 n=1 Tax=Dichomitus squalens TaxID=114155 RepID=A0A4Q9MJA6_9APHY|nr:high nitrogen upregulated cytochrome P450 monooxygenase 2 [Dichomitus squalens]